MIEAYSLRRAFRSKVGDVEAVAAVDLAVEQGEIFAFLGPNRAGKTTMRILVTLLAPPASCVSPDPVREVGR